MIPLVNRKRHRKQFLARRGAVLKHKIDIQKSKGHIARMVNSQFSDPFQAQRNPFLDSPSSQRVDPTKVNIKKTIYEE